MHICMKKKKGKEKYYLNVAVSVMVGLGQAFLPNLQPGVFKERTIDDLFLIYIVIIPILIKIMKTIAII